MMLLCVNNLVRGFSGAREETIQCLVDMLNQRVYPAVYEQGMQCPLNKFEKADDAAPKIKIRLKLLDLHVFPIEHMPRIPRIDHGKIYQL